MKIRYVVSALSLSACGLLGITQWEGFSSEAYIPIAGDVPTIGFGSTSNVELGDKITVPDALTRLYRDVGNAESAINACVHVPLSQGEYDAYTSLSFNIGRGAFCSSTLVKKLNAGDYEGACEEILRWKYANGRVVDGLAKRRAYEYQVCKGE